MIIYGSNSSHLKTVQLTQETCPHCSTQGSMILSTYAKYAHIFWIPIFPLGRISASQCQHCKQVLEVKQMPAQIRAYHDRNIAESRVPIWQFAGLALIVISIAFAIYSNGIDKKQQASFLENPKSGDIYEYKIDGGNYTTLRLVSVRNDSVEVNFNNYQVDKITGISNIDKDENYSDTTYVLPRAQLNKMFAAGDITDINRR